MTFTRGQINELELLIRAGQMGHARTLLLSLQPTKVPRAFAAEAADIARRLNMLRLAVLILRPIVRPETHLTSPPSTHEQALYAHCLSRLGVFKEAHELLTALPDQTNPEVLLFLASNHIYQWHDAAAIPLLKRYIRCKGLSEYSRLVGQVNLAECLIAERKWPEATDILNEVAQISAREGEKQRLLLGYTHLLAAQMQIHQKLFDNAKLLSDQANILLAGSRSRYELYAKSWAAILNLMNEPGSPEALARLHDIRGELAKSNHWEAVRNSELFEALATDNQYLLIRLYNGTAHDKFRSKIKDLAKGRLTIPKLREIFPDLLPPPTGLQPYLLHKTQATSPLLSRLLDILSKDIYRPVSLGSLISQLYPEEYFNPITSPAKAIQAIKLMRAWFKRNQVPLRIGVVRGHVKLMAAPGFRVRIEPSPSASPKSQAFLEELNSRFSTQPFTTKDVADALGLSLRSARTLINEALRKRKLTRLASGRTTRFRFNRQLKSQSKTAA